MLKKSASFVLASFRPSTYPRGYACSPSLAAALLDGLFEHPASPPALWKVKAQAKVEKKRVRLSLNLDLDLSLH
jgi:hypothetical protein